MKTICVFLSFFGISLSQIPIYSPQFISSFNETLELKPFVSISKGVVLNKLAGINLYESSIPIKFVLELPKIKDSSIFKKNQSCTSAQKYLCSILAKAREVYDYLIKDILSTHPYIFQNETNSRERRSAPLSFIGDGYRWLFGVATLEDTGKLHVSQDLLNSRQKDLKEAVSLDHQILVEVTSNLKAYHEKTSEIFKDGFDVIQEKIDDSRRTAFGNEGTLAEIASIQMHTEYLNTVISNLNSAASDCRMQIIPRSLLPEETLETKLNLLEANLYTKGYELSTNLNSLWKLSICDCVFSNSHVELTLHVPIKKRNIKFDLYEIIRVPFSFQDFQCRIMDETEFIAVSSDNEIIVPISKKINRYCKPFEKGVCLIPQHNYDPGSFSNCGAASFSGNREQITKQCIMECTKTDLVRISQAGIGILAITGAKTLKFFCYNQTTARNYELEKNIGAVLVSIPCHCKLQVDLNTRMIDPPFPCLSINEIEQEDVNHILPTHMTKLTSIIFTEPAGKYDDLKSLVDHNWTLKLPTLNISTPAPLNWTADWKTSILSYKVENNTFLIYLWLVALTLVLLALVFAICSGNAGAQGSTSNSTGFNPLSLIPLLLIALPGVFCEGESNTVTVGDAFMTLLKVIEISNIILGIIFTCIGLIILYLIIKIYKFTKGTYSITKSIMMEDRR